MLEEYYIVIHTRVKPYIYSLRPYSEIMDQFRETHLPKEIRLWVQSAASHLTIEKRDINMTQLAIYSKQERQNLHRSLTQYGLDLYKEITKDPEWDLLPDQVMLQGLNQYRDLVIKILSTAYLDKLLEEVSGNLVQAAKLAKINRQNLRRMSIQYGINIDKYRHSPEREDREIVNILNLTNSTSTAGFIVSLEKAIESSLPKKAHYMTGALIPEGSLQRKIINRTLRIWYSSLLHYAKKEIGEDGDKELVETAIALTREKQQVIFSTAKQYGIPLEKMIEQATYHQPPNTVPFEFIQRGVTEFTQLVIDALSYVAIQRYVAHVPQQPLKKAIVARFAGVTEEKLVEISRRLGVDIK